MKKILLSLLLAGGVQNSFAMQDAGGGQAAESGFRLEGQVPVIFKDGSVANLDLQRLQALNSGLLEGMLFTADGFYLGDVSEGNPFAMTRFANLAAFENFEKILKGELSGEIADMKAFIEDADFLDIDWLKHLQELKERDLQKFFALYTALLADKIDFEEPSSVKPDFIILLEKVFPNLLIEATKSNEFEAAKMLIATGANVNASNGYGETALRLAAKHGQTGTALLLIASGADVNASNGFAETALTLAAENGHVEIVRLLIAAGNGYSNNKALIDAAKMGHAEIVKLLIDARADVNARSSDGYSITKALIEAAKMGHTEIVKLLIAAGADVDAKNEQGVTALNGAARNGHVDVVQELLSKNPDVDLMDSHGWTALTNAATNGMLDVVEELLKKRASVNMPNKKGRTALMLAAEKGHIEVVRVLLAKGAKVENCLSKKPEISALLQKHKFIQDSQAKPAPRMAAAGGGVARAGGSEVAPKILKDADVQTGRLDELVQILPSGAQKRLSGSLVSPLSRPKTTAVQSSGAIATTAEQPTFGIATSMALLPQGSAFVGMQQAMAMPVAVAIQITLQNLIVLAGTNGTGFLGLMQLLHYSAPHVNFDAHQAAALFVAMGLDATVFVQASYADITGLQLAEVLRQNIIDLCGHDVYSSNIPGPEQAALMSALNQRFAPYAQTLGN